MAEVSVLLPSSGRLAAWVFAGDLIINDNRLFTTRLGVD